MGVKLRERQLDSGKISLYLDIYHKGKRNYEFLDLHLEVIKKNREIRRLAEAIRSKRELQLYNKQYDFEHNDEDITLTDFIIHLKDNSNKTSSKNYGSVLHHLKAYHKKEKVRFDDLTSAWLEGFRAYLLSKVKKSTARTYFLIFRSLLNKAAAKGYIKGNPLNRYDIENIEKDPALDSVLN
ncbi:phage integrase SAM-like domain and Arm DNA-binding domain-containing protein [Rhodohalobacter sp.]|uniref:phage integrase SAM-like domain and Arm DNA-binding domain-containing protein n=1 Tax=Rhodohalobacter sp. TaxID=1974210 RepID=UPI002ACE2165|nr:phage integrase SAM-like domain and Arm DNA-binding domain-containing protein [Rhodohalobacter sp.]MDZ7757179.1 phage integrase SAM-like domain and Arm DNA-binding domain-containing protein [Rhodohalobacter sp.]